MMKRMIFFDIDGTLLDHEKKVPATTRESIRQLQEAGHIVAIATGRAPYHFEELREELGIDSYVCLNGQYVVHEGKPIYGNPLAQDSLQQLTEQAVLLDHPIIYAGSEAMKMNVTEHVHIDSAGESSNLQSRNMIRNIIWAEISIRPLSSVRRKRNRLMRKVSRDSLILCVGGLMESMFFLREVQKPKESNH